MTSELIGVLLMFLLTVILAWPLGNYITKVYLGTKTLFDFFAPLENFIFKLSGINSKREMTWQEHLKAMLTINLIWFFWAMFILMNQGWLPLNPDGNPSMSADLAFNTAVSFISNTNLQHYSGESSMSYLGQLGALTFFQFVSAGTGMAMCIVVFNAMRSRTTNQLGNFYNYFLKSCTRILLPLSFVVAVFVLFNGSPMTFEGKQQIITLQGDTVLVSRGPAAAMIGIKQIGTNGGGFFGANSAHPLENPNYWTNMVENISIILIPIAMVFALGFYLNRKRLAWTIFGVMTIGFLLLLIPTIFSELNGNPSISKLGIDQSLGNLEGKELRFGSAASAFWAITTTVTSNGSINSMHDSFTPLSGMNAMLGMMINALYGGVGVGFLNFYVFIILAVFISGLMVGRTPEFLGKKIEAREMKIAMIIALLHPFLILSGTALASFIFVTNPSASVWLNNPSFHGYSEMLYEYSSASANNGSEFAGLTANTLWFNISTGIIMCLARFLPIIGPVAIAGILANKKFIPESAGTLKTDTSTFGLMVFAVIVIIAALSFFPALTLGPIAEYFSMK